MWLGMVRAALGQTSLVGGPVGALADAANGAAGAALEPLAAALGAIAEAFAQMPGGQVALPLGSRAGVLIAYVALALAVLAARRLLARVDPEPDPGRVAPHPRRAPTAWLAAAAGAVLAIAIAAALAPPRPPAELTVSFLDVGQGDATLIQHPDGSAVLFDTGPPEGRVARLLRRAGVRRLSALVLTHASRDHHGGAAEVVRRFPVDVLLDGGDGTADRDFRAASARGGPRRRAPDRGHRPGTASRRAASRYASSPRGAGPPAPRPEDPNQRAVVAIVSAGGLDLLLSADAESPSLLPLALPRVDAMKVPHHGSADPGLGGRAPAAAPADRRNRGGRREHLRPPGARHPPRASARRRPHVPHRPPRDRPAAPGGGAADGGDRAVRRRPASSIHSDPWPT